MALKLSRFQAAFLLILLLAIAFRFWDLGLKPVHHDEAVHAWITYYDVTLRGIEAYRYDPSYHGPFQYFMNAPLYLWSLPNDAIIRVLPCTFGVMLVALVYPLRHRLGEGGALATALLLAVSPSMVYQSRFARNDMYVEVFTLLIVMGVLFFMEKRRPPAWERAVLSALLAFTFLPIAVFSHFTQTVSDPSAGVGGLNPVAAGLGVVPLVLLVGFTVYSLYESRREHASKAALAKRDTKRGGRGLRRVAVPVAIAVVAVVVVALALGWYLGLTPSQQVPVSQNIGTYLLLMVFVSLLALLVLFEDGPEFYLYVAATALALSFSTNENTLMNVGVFVGYVLLWGSDRLLGWSQRLRKVWRPWGGEKPKPLRDGPLGALVNRKRLRQAALPAAVTAAGVAVVVLLFNQLGLVSFSITNPLELLNTTMFLCAVVGLGALLFYFRRNPTTVRLLFMVIAVFLFAYSLFYSNLFTHPERIGGAFPSGVAHWYEMHSIARIGGPPEFYLSRLLLYESLAFVGGIIAMFYYAIRRDSFMLFCAVWALGSLAAYSYVQEKVPWLIVNILLPYALLSGKLIGEKLPRWLKAARSSRRAREKASTAPGARAKGEGLPVAGWGRASAIAKLGLLGVGVFFLVWFSVLVNFNHPANPAEPMSQVECSWDVRQTVQRIAILVEQNQGVNTTEYFVFNGVDYWPFPYYQVNYQRVRYCLDADGTGGQPAKDPVSCAQDYGDNFTDVNIIIADRSRANEVDNILGPEYHRVDMPRYRWCAFDMYHLGGYLSFSWLFWRDPVQGTCGSYDITFFYRIIPGTEVTEEMLKQAWDNRDYEFWAQLFEARWGYPFTQDHQLTPEFLQQVWDADQYHFYAQLYEQYYGQPYTGTFPRW